MARNRMIKPEFWEDDKVNANCSPFARLLFIALWNFSDDDGYLEKRDAWLKIKCFPYDDDLNINNLLEELIEVGCISIQNKIINVVNFKKHQKIDRPRKSFLKDSFIKQGKLIKLSAPQLPSPPIAKEPPQEPQKKLDFYEIWNSHPKRQGSLKTAHSIFKTTVKNKKDFEEIKKAIINYCAYVKESSIEEKFILKASNWFTEWQGWVDYKVKADPKKSRERRIAEKDKETAILEELSGVKKIKTPGLSDSAGKKKLEEVMVSFRGN